MMTREGRDGEDGTVNFRHLRLFWVVAREGSLVGAIGGQRYINDIYDRYVVYTNLLVTDEQAAQLLSGQGEDHDGASSRVR